MVKPSVLRNNLRSAELVGALPHGTAACLLETRVRVSCAGVCVNILTLIESSVIAAMEHVTHSPKFPTPSAVDSHVLGSLVALPEVICLT